MIQADADAGRKTRHPYHWPWLAIPLLLSLGFTDPLCAAPPEDKYQAAAQKYQEGHLNESYLLLLENLKTHPDNAPTLVLLAKTLYRMERFNEAARYFEKVDLKLLDPDTTFEYGVTMYGAKRCDDALRAFIAVPKSHRYQNYARFYSGACYLQDAQYTKALIKLRKAVGLPPMLNAMRRNLIAVTRKQIELQAHGPAKSAPTAAETTTPTERPEHAQKQTGGTQAEAVLQSALTVDVTPSEEIKYSEVQNNYHNYKFEYWAGTSSTANVDLNAKYQLAPVSRAPNPYLNLFLNVKRFDQVATQPTVTLDHDKTTGTYSYTHSNPPQPVILTNEYTGAPGLTLPFSAGSSFTTKFEYWHRESTDPNLSLHESHEATIGTLHSNFAALDLDSELGINYTEHQGTNNATDEYDTTVNVGLARNFKIIDIHMGGSYLSRKLPAGHTYSTSAAGETKGNANVTIPIDKFSLFGGAEYLRLTPGGGNLYVDQSKMEKADFTASLERPFDFGLTLKAQGGYELFYDLTYKDQLVGDVDADPLTAEKRLGKADGTQTSASVSAAQSLFGFMTFTVYGKYTQTDYQGLDPAIAPAFYKQAADLIYEWGVILNLKKAF